MIKFSTSGPVERRRGPVVGIPFLCAAGFGAAEILDLRIVFRFCFLGAIGNVRRGLTEALVTLSAVFVSFCATLLTCRLVTCGGCGECDFSVLTEIRLPFATLFLNCWEQAPDHEDFQWAVTLGELSPLWILVLCVLREEICFR